jgi:hypothetical protein
MKSYAAFDLPDALCCAPLIHVSDDQFHSQSDVAFILVAQTLSLVSTDICHQGPSFIDFCLHPLESIVDDTWQV